MARTLPLDLPIADAVEWCCEIVNNTQVGNPVGDSVAPGDKVVVFSRGRQRLVKVVKVTPKKVTVAYTTEGGLNEAQRRGWDHVAVTEKAVDRVDTYWPKVG